MLKKNLDTLKSAKEKIKTARELVESLYEYEPHDRFRKYEDKDLVCDMIYEEALDNTLIWLGDLIGAIEDLVCDIIYEEALDNTLIWLGDLIGAIELAIETKGE